MTTYTDYVNVSVNQTGVVRLMLFEQVPTNDASLTLQTEVGNYVMPLPVAIEMAQIILNSNKELMAKIGAMQ